MKLLCLLLAFLICTIVCLGQIKRVSLIKADGRVTLSRDSALFIRTITGPEKSTGLYDFSESFSSGELYRTGKSNQPDLFLYDGDFTEYYLNGNKLSYTTYDKFSITSQTIYYPNGLVSWVKQYNITHPNAANTWETQTKEFIITCNDAEGKAEVTDGNGYFKNYLPLINTKLGSEKTDSPIFTNADHVLDYEEGPVKNKLRDGVWKGENKIFGYNYIENYKAGKFIDGTSTDKNGIKYHYTNREEEGEYKGGIEAFYDYLSKTIRYPPHSREKKIQGKVFVTFVIEKDGSLHDIKVLRAPSEEIGIETTRVIAASPLWKPCLLRGILVRQQYTVPVSFTLSDN